MSDRDVVLLCAGAVFTVMVIPVSRRVRTALLLLVVGFGMMQGPSISNTIIQTLTTEDKRVRVMSYYTAAFFGMTPFGSLLAGTLADRFGPLHTLIMAGACCLAGALWFTLELPKMRAVMRPIYQEMGLLPVRNPQ